MSNTHRLLGILMVGVALGCSGDDGGGSNAGTGGTGVAAAGGTVATTAGTVAGTIAGMAGTAAGAAAGMAAGTAAGTGGGTVDNCGGVACTVPDNLATVAPPCCDPNTNTCGMMGQFLCVPVYNDPGGHSCPSESIMGMEIPGCCADGMACGIVDTLAGTGCATRALAGVVLGLLDPNIVLNPINCDGTVPPPQSTDAGTPMP